jgi:hypothetical protein
MWVYGLYCTLFLWDFYRNELVETIHHNPFISTWVHTWKDRLGHGHDSCSEVRVSQLGVAEDLDLLGYDTELLGLYFLTSGGL